MILNSKETTISYRCPVCGKNIMSLVGIFTLTGDMIKLKCDCGGSELVITRTADNKIRLTVPCLICPNPHNYLISSNAFFDKSIFTLSCTYSDIDICFIGSKDEVRKAVKRADRELISMLDGAGFDDYNMFAQGRDSLGNNKDDLYNLDYAQIEDIVHFVLTELREEGDIHCGCGEADEPEYDFEFEKDSVRIFCKTCGSETLVPMTSTLSANAFLHCDSLTLQKKQ